MNSRCLFLLMLAIGMHTAQAQDADTFAIPEPEPEIYAEETFRTFRLVNGHSTETLWGRNLHFGISHRFQGPVSDGVKTFWGLDQYADIRFELGYGVTDNLSIGAGRSRANKLYDTWAKYRVLRQRTRGWPLTVTVFASASADTDEWSAIEQEALSFRHRLAYCGQVLIASRITSFLSVQAAPMVVHRNLVSAVQERNTLYALTLAARARITDKIAVLAEYTRRLNPAEVPGQPRYDAFGIGLDFTTPRHGFQIQFTNTNFIIEQAWVPETPNAFRTRGPQIGFHITRLFQL